MIDLNCDIGEELDDALDAALFPLITSASIACGGHAGSPGSMAVSVERALTHGVAIGAHLSYPDRDGFGRAEMALSPEALTSILVQQASALRDIAERAGGHVAYVKPHGALYHAASASAQIAAVLLDVANGLAEETCIIGMPGGEVEAAAGPRFVAEGFPERGYRSADALQSRSLPGALVEDPDVVAERAVAMAAGAAIELVDGAMAHLDVRTLCIHSDHPNALANAMAVRAALANAGIDVRAFSG